jgi:hypothetical protein
VEAKIKEIKEEKEGSAKLRREVSDLKETVKQMTAEAASQATAAQQLGESAKMAKAKAEAAYTRVRIYFMKNSSSVIV